MAEDIFAIVKHFDEVEKFQIKKFDVEDSCIHVLMTKGNLSILLREDR